MAKTNERKRPNTRIVRTVRLAIACLCLVWFGRFAYVRSTTMPPGVLRWAPDETPDDDATADLAGAIARLPSFAGAATTIAPNPFMGNRTEVADALRGDWTPQSRPFLTKIIKHITSPKVNSVLDDLVEVSDNNWTMSDTLGVGTPAMVTPWDLREPIDALLVRARLKHVERNDATGALSDLLAALRLCGPAAGRSAFWGEINSSSVVAAQIRLLAIEREVSLAESAPLLDYVRSEFPDSISAGILARLSLKGAHEQILDRFYTDDGNGGGWLVLSELGGIHATPGIDSGTRSRCWNVLSPLFSGRAEIAAKLEQYLSEFARIDTLKYYRGQQALKQLRMRQLFNVTDGPFVRLRTELSWQSVPQAALDVLVRRALVVALALSAYKSEHGEYPESLDELTPDYLDRVPLDILTAKPFDYRRSDNRYDFNKGQPLPGNLPSNPLLAQKIALRQKVYEQSRATPLNEPAAGGGR